MIEVNADSPRRNAIREWLESPPCRIGQIFIDRDSTGGFVLRHRDDLIDLNLVLHSEPEAAGEIARFDNAGAFRPLKTAPNLRHGWRLSLATVEEVIAALELFYPGRLAAYLAWRSESLSTTPFRETLARQTGMYRITAKIDDAQAETLIGNFCRSDGGCLRTLLWKRDAAGTIPSTLLPPQKFDPDHDQTGHGEAALPLLCQEACNFLVAEARKVVKAAA